MSLVWTDGQWLEQDAANLDVFHAGEGLFETVRVKDGRLAFLQEHLERLYRSAEHFDLQLVDRSELEQACLMVPSQNAQPNGRLRVFVDRGSITVSMVPFDGYSETLYEEGAVVLIAPRPGHPLGEHAGEKVLPYAPLMVPRAAAEAAGAVDVVFWDDDNAFLEGTSCNLFVARRGKLWTPPLTRRILPGILRQMTLVAAEKLGIEAVEADVFVHDLDDAQEAFITSSLRDVMPLRQIGQTTLAPGPLARALRAEVGRMAAP